MGSVPHSAQRDNGNAVPPPQPSPALQGREREGIQLISWLRGGSMLMTHQMPVTAAAPANTALAL